MIRNYLPIKINNDYWNHLDEHLKLNNKIGDYDHIEKCEVCINYKKVALIDIDSRIEETISLIEKIENLTSKAANKG